MQRTLYADPRGRFLHDAILAACERFPNLIAIVDTSTSPPLRLTYAQYGERIRSLASGLVAAGMRPGDVLAIYLPNSWEFCSAFHAAALAGVIPTLLNPSYREREVRYQLENSGAAMLLTDGPLIQDMNFDGLPGLRGVYTTRTAAAGARPFNSLLHTPAAPLPAPLAPPEDTIAALPYSSGTTGLPKGVMLSHLNLLANSYQLVGAQPGGIFRPDERILLSLPLYHIYGLNVILNPALLIGCTLVLMPRFETASAQQLLLDERITMAPVVPPILNALVQAAERGNFPRDHCVSWVKCGAAPLPPDLARKFTAATGILVRQGYGMTEASPVTHVGFIEPERYRPESIGWPVAETECRVITPDSREAADDEPGELVMRGPQFMLGYWHAPEATSAVLRDGWFWSGDVVRRDREGFYYVLDRSKEMIKYKGFPVAPAEIEALLLEHPAVLDCGVVGRPDADAGQFPCAFVVLREGFAPSARMESELMHFVGDQLTAYKRPREVNFVASIPHTPSGKILRRELRKLIEGDLQATSE
jgi:acyl-CoA synthetase (AMP-forming)/AMP-acid ligase II